MSNNNPFSANTQNPYAFSDTPQVQLPTDMQRGLVHQNEPVKHAFAMGEQGRTAAEIKNHFARLSG